MAIPPEYAVVFLQGGATLIQALLPLNFAAPGQAADYVLTGHWGEKAVDQARPHADEIGRASCRARVCQYVSISVVAASFKKKEERPEERGVGKKCARTSRSRRSRNPNKKK